MKIKCISALFFLFSYSFLFSQECEQEYDGSNLENKLLIHYELNGNTLDSGPKTIHGTNNGAIISSDRFEDQSAYSFDGNSNIVIPHDNSYKVQFPMSISTWVKWENDSPQKNGVFSTNFEQNNYHGVFMLRLANSGKLFFGYGTGTGGITLENRRAIISDFETDLNKWYHIAGVINGPNDFHFYINGCEDTFSYTGDENSSIAYNDNDGFLGKVDNSNNFPSNDLIGSIDDFYFWNRSITEEEVLYLYDRFEIPEMDLNNVYTILDGQDDIIINLSDEFIDVEWSDGQSGNAATFTEEGTYQVEAYYNCHLVCFEFIIEKEPEIVNDCDSDISADNINNDLLVHFDLNGDAEDNTPFMSHGSISGVNASLDRFGITNGAMQFTTNDEITIPKEDRFEITFPFSISFWANFATSGSTKQGGIFSSNFSQDDYSGIIVNRNGDGQISCQVGNGTGSISPASTKSMVTVDEIPKDKWTHIAIRLNGANSGDIFINGCEVPVFYGGTGVWNIVYRNVPMKIGRTDTSSNEDESENYLHGALDDFYFWERIISEEEIHYLYDRFEVPELNLGDNNIECEELISIEVDNIFTDVVWSDGQQGNIGAFASDGFYTVQGMYNCYPVCADFTISADSEVTLDLQDTIQICDTVFILESPFDVLWEDGTFGSQIQVNESGLFRLYNICGVELDNVFVNLISTNNNLEEEYTICKDEQIIVSLPDTYDNISWSNGSSGNEFTISEEGLYLVEYSYNNCMTEETFIVETKRCELCEFYMPNIFRPNSTGGNELFQINSNSLECLESSIINILDRWGNHVYNEKANIPWDGIINGKLASEGVYVFHISGSIGDSIISQYGNITIVY